VRACVQGLRLGGALAFPQIYMGLKKLRHQG
jgi:hypothetical protein